MQNLYYHKSRCANDRIIVWLLMLLGLKTAQRRTQSRSKRPPA